MSTERFRAHARACVDAAIHRVFQSFASRPRLHAVFARLVELAHTRSGLLERLPADDDPWHPVRALANLARFHAELVRNPDDWPGAAGHPLAVIHALAQHLLARYPTPRFLASAWFGTGSLTLDERRRWFVRLGAGAAVRDLGLPIPLTRRMAHVFVRTPDHVPIPHALRRAEVLGLGGSEALAAAVVATRLVDLTSHPHFWRTTLGWLVRFEDELDLGALDALVVHLAARTHEPVHPVRALRPGELGRVVGRARLPAPSSWPRARWRPLSLPARDGRWQLLELCDREALAAEGRAMQHCVGGYAARCVAGTSRIWSLRHDDGEAVRPVLTIEVDPRRDAIVQVKGERNALPAPGVAWDVVRLWAQRERLQLDPAVVPRRVA